MILDVDAGNTRLKWRLTSHGGVPQRGDASSARELVSRVSAVAEPRRVRLASVRGSDWLREVQQCLHDAWALQAEVVGSQKSLCGVRNAYDEPSALGVDRWLALVAASQRCEGFCVVVDCGTALTLDAVDVERRHLGGFIVPGLSMQYRSLTDAALIRLSPDIGMGVDLRPGRSTVEAVAHGCLAMIAGWLGHDAMVRRASAEGGFFLTGGDAGHLSPLLREAGLSVRQEPELVLDGIALALP